MGIQVAKSVRALIWNVSFVGCVLLLPSCGLFETPPAFGAAEERDALSALTDVESSLAGECEVLEDCPVAENIEASCVEQRCVYACETGFVGRGGERLADRCECASSVEVCDGQDNDCDGVVDNLFNDATIAVGGAHTCATDVSGAVYCWGANNHGQLGIGTDTWHAKPTRLPGSTDLQIDQLAAGETHTCALSTEQAAIWCWGSNAHGQLGDTTTDDRLEPVKVDFPGEPLYIAAGKSHTCALNAEGKLYCWGNNSAGELGIDNNEINAKEPTAAVSELTLQSIAAGDAHTCGLTQNNKIFCWGDNALGQLGVGDFNPRDGHTEPSAMPVEGTFYGVTVAGALSCALHAEGSVYCWGDDTNVPQPFEDAQGAEVNFSGALITVSAHADFCALNAQDGALRCGKVGEELAPVAVAGSEFYIFAAGFKHLCALSQNGRAYCWGDNIAGQIGDNTRGGSRSTPVAASCG